MNTQYNLRLSDLQDPKVQNCESNKDHSDTFLEDRVYDRHVEIPLRINYSYNTIVIIVFFFDKYSAKTHNIHKF